MKCTNCGGMSQVETFTIPGSCGGFIGEWCQPCRQAGVRVKNFIIAGSRIDISGQFEEDSEG